MIAMRLVTSAALRLHAVFSACLIVLLVVVWASTTRGYFWPGWALLGLALVAGLHALSVFAGRPSARRRALR